MKLRFVVSVELDPEDRREAAKVAAARQLLLGTTVELIKASAT